MKGTLIGNDILRVYSGEVGEFTDYKIAHTDLEVEIIDDDFQVRSDNVIDHSNKTLGLE